MNSKRWRMGALILLMTLAASGEFGCSRSAGYYIDYGNKLFDKGKYEEASLNYRKAAQRDPRSGEAYHRLGLAALKLGQGADAYNALTRAEELLPMREDVKIELGDLVLAAYLADGHRPQKLYDQLTRISRQLLARNPNSFDGLRFEGDLALTDGKLSQAAEFFQRANRARPMQPNVVSVWVDSLFKQNEFAEGEKLAQELIQKHKDFLPIYDVLYQRYMASNRAVEAENLLKTEISNNRSNQGAILQLAAHYHKMQQNAEMRSTLQTLLDNPKNFPAAHRDVGDFYLSIADPNNAMQQFQAGLREDPKDKISYQKRMVNILIAQKKTDDALQLLDEIVQSQPKDFGAKAMRAELWLNSGENLDGALREFQELVNQAPSDEVLRFNLGRAYILQGNLTDARTQFLEAARESKSYVAPRAELAALGQRMGDYSETLRYANEIQAIDPRQPAGKLWHCVALIGLGNYQQARGELTGLLRDFPKSLEAQLVAAQLAMAETRFKDAETIYRGLYKPGAEDLRPLQGLITAMAKQSQFGPALQVVTNELKLAPNSAALHRMLASAAVGAGNLDLAIAQYEWIIAKNPKDIDAYVNLSAVYTARGDRGAAVARLQEARKADPSNTKVNERLAYLEIYSGKQTAAIADYRKQLAIRPDDAVAMNNLAALLADSGVDLDEAMDLAGKARQKLPNNPSVADTLAWIYVKKQMNDAAVGVLTELTKKHPEVPEFRYHLGVALLQKGDNRKAKEEFEAGLSMRPTKDIEDKIRRAIAGIS